MEQRLDPDGFPVPPKYEQLRPDDQAARPLISIKALLILTIILGLLGTFGYFKGPELMATWFMKRAQSKLLENDLDQALVDSDKAIEFMPDSAVLYQQRGYMRMEAHDLDGSLKDFDKVIELVPSYAPAYAARGSVYLLKQDYTKAIDDFTRAADMLPETEPSVRNSRAYARALGDVQLEEGLTDIEIALRLVDKEQSPLPYAAYIDTRGYLYYRLGKYDEALADFDEAIKLTGEVQTGMNATRTKPNVNQALLKRNIRKLDEDLAVMHHHRGLTYEALGKTEEAQKDLKQADELGYDPERGVF